MTSLTCREPVVVKILPNDLRRMMYTCCVNTELTLLDRMNVAIVRELDRVTTTGVKPTLSKTFHKNFLVSNSVESQNREQHVILTSIVLDFVHRVKIKKSKSREKLITFLDRTVEFPNRVISNTVLSLTLNLGYIEMSQNELIHQITALLEHRESIGSNVHSVVDLVPVFEFAS